jgi:ABC-type transport system involved in cytochrome bd biosynthesis fused ATPase/permease subunit
MPSMGSPAITLRCDCGAEGRATFGDSWECPTCGRRYDTSQIPADDYGAIEALDRRYRRMSQAIMVVLALLVLAVAWTGQLLPIFAGLSVVMLSWFLYIRPLVHRQHRRAVSNLTRSWELKAQ